MEPFVIQCTTCRARLKVTDPALVGDIVGCPKCESFVQVTPPAGWQAPASGTTVTAVVLKPKSAMGGPASVPPPLPPDVPAARGLSAHGKAAKPAPAASGGPASLIVPEPAAEPGIVGQLLAAARQRVWLTVAGAALTIVAVVAIAWLALRSPNGTEPPSNLNQSSLAAQQLDSQVETGDIAPGDSADQTSPAPANESAVSESESPHVPAAESVASDPASPAQAEPPAAANTSAQDAAPSEPAAPASTAEPGHKSPLDSIARALATELEPTISTDPSAAAHPGGRLDQWPDRQPRLDRRRSRRGIRRREAGPAGGPSAG